MNETTLTDQIIISSICPNSRKRNRNDGSNSSIIPVPHSRNKNFRQNGSSSMITSRLLEKLPIREPFATGFLSKESSRLAIVSSDQSTTSESSTSSLENEQIVPPTILIDKIYSNPQDFVDYFAKAEGYDISRISALETDINRLPNAIQLASYGKKMLSAIRTCNDGLLRKLLACGLSPNSCNKFGESVLHMVCRRKDYKLLRTLVENGCYLRICDDFGRTPLHDAFWTVDPCFQCVELILEIDASLLFVTDCRGFTPLQYIRREHWEEWISFFKRNAGKIWPRSLANKSNIVTPIPFLTSSEQHDLIEMHKIASGELDLEEVMRRSNFINHGK